MPTLDEIECEIEVVRSDLNQNQSEYDELRNRKEQYENEIDDMVRTFSELHYEIDRLQTYLQQLCSARAEELNKRDSPF